MEIFNYGCLVTVAFSQTRHISPSLRLFVPNCLTEYSNPFLLNVSMVQSSWWFSSCSRAVPWWGVIRFRVPIHFYSFFLYLIGRRFNASGPWRPSVKHVTICIPVFVAPKTVGSNFLFELIELPFKNFLDLRYRKLVPKANKDFAMYILHLILWCLQICEMNKALNIWKIDFNIK
jgi:hypothetical protein